MKDSFTPMPIPFLEALRGWLAPVFNGTVPLERKEEIITKRASLGPSLAGQEQTQERYTIMYRYVHLHRLQQTTNGNTGESEAATRDEVCSTGREGRRRSWTISVKCNTCDVGYEKSVRGENGEECVFGSRQTQNRAFFITKGE